MKALLTLLLLMLLAAPALAAEALDGAGLDQRLGARVPVEARFYDEGGHVVRLGSLLTGRPVVLALVYFRCPNLCTGLLNGLVETLLTMGPTVGRDFDVLAVSIDPREKPTLAASRFRQYTRLYGRTGAATGWHFLTGDEPAIKALAGAVGYHYRYDVATRQYAHPAAFVVLSPNGRVMRYFLGMRPPQGELAQALKSARAGITGSAAVDVILRCFHYDPAESPYGPLIAQLLRAAGAATLAALALGLWWLTRTKEARR